MQRGRFVVALSGGSTPKAIYERLKAEKIEWEKVWLFWSDERAGAVDSAESNYRMVMESLGNVGVPVSQIFRMKTEKDIENNALDYEEKIHRHLDKHLFDLVMLGVGEDGHTASLFPGTAALREKNRLVVANHISEKKSWRMTFTFPCINNSLHAVIYALGASKHLIVPKVLDAAIDSEFPASKVGTPEHKALWILDDEAAKILK